MLKMPMASYIRHIIYGEKIKHVRSIFLKTKKTVNSFEVFCSHIIVDEIIDHLNCYQSAQTARLFGNQIGHLLYYNN